MTVENGVVVFKQVASITVRAYGQRQEIVLCGDHHRQAHDTEAECGRQVLAALDEMAVKSGEAKHRAQGELREMWRVLDWITQNAMTIDLTNVRAAQEAVRCALEDNGWAGPSFAREVEASYSAKAARKVLG